MRCTPGSKTMGNRGAEPVRVYYNWVEHKTEKGLLIHIPGKEKAEWFPRKEISTHSLLENYIEIPRWLAKRKEIKYAEAPVKPIPRGLSVEPDYSRKRKRSDRP